MIVADASAILATLLDEPGGEHLKKLGEPFLLSTVTHCEVVTVLTAKGFVADDIREIVDPFRQKCRPLTPGQAVQAGLWRAATRKRGLSLGDRCCLALAKELGATVLTADRAWEGLGLGVQVRLVR